VSSHPRRWAALSVIALAQFVVIMDTSIIGVALPKMRADLGFSPDGLQWVFNGFVVAFGGLLLLGGRLSDLFGARRVFATGWAVLLAGSVVSAVADSAGAVVAGRAVQGAGSALIAPAALTLLMSLFAGTAELPKALALYGAAAPAGGTAGVFLGGVITEWLSWPWIFWLYVPIAAAVLLATPAVMPAPAGRRGSVDVAGALTVTAGLAVAVLGVVRAPTFGWGSGQTVGALVAAALLLVVFLLIEAKVSTPLVRLGIFLSPMLPAANLAQLLLGAAWVPLWFFLNLYLQQVLGYGAFASGAALLPMTVLIMVLMVAVAPKLIARFGVKPLIVAGLLALAAGLFWLSLARPGGNFAVDVLPASLVAALGQALAFIPSLGTALSSAPPHERGLAAGIVNTAYQVGSALGLAAMTAVGAANGAGRLSDVTALTGGYTAAFTGAALIAAAGSVLIAVTLRTPRPGTAETDAAEREPAATG
jgi:EmrB/QacA subfamily drug resistance transporter